MDFDWIGLVLNQWKQTRGSTAYPSKQKVPSASFYRIGCKNDKSSPVE